MTTSFRDQVNDFKKERIIEEASKLFYERGYRGTTLDAIADRLEVSKPFIYHHFTGKAELLVEIYTRVLRFSLDAVEEAAKVAGSARHKLRAFAIAYTRLVIKDQAIVAIFFREEQNLPEAQLDEINRIKGEFDDKLSKLLEDGVKSGEFHIDDVRLATLAIVGMMSWIYQWYRADRRLSPEAIAERMADLTEQLVGVAAGAAVT